jgi:hypothetical protein
MNRITLPGLSGPFGQLLWKDVRLVMPLAVGALSLGWLILLIGLLFETLWPGRTSIAWFDRSLAMLMLSTGLYAAGVGGLLIGMEKENRTDLLLARLPVRVDLIFLSKLIAATSVGLALVLAGATLSWLLGTVGGATRQSGPWGGVNTGLLLGHLVYLGLLSMALHWRIKNSLLAIACLLPLALAPLLLTWVILPIPELLGASVAGGGGPAYGERVLLASQLLLSVVALGLSWRFALRHFRPESAAGGWVAAFPARLRSRWPVSAQPVSAQPVSAQPVAAQPVAAEWFNLQTYGPSTALLWHGLQQHRGWLRVLLAMSLCSGLTLFGLLLIEFFGRGLWTGAPFGQIVGGAATAWTFLAAGLASSWLGAAVFLPESPSGYRAFLATRGIPPRRLWWLRHLPPLSILSLGLVPVMIPYLIYLPGLAVSSSPAAYPAIWLLSPIAVGIVYVAGQWSAQLIGSWFLATLLAPLASAVAFGFAFGMLAGVGVSWWYLLVWPVIGLVATFGGMGQWLDRRIGFRYWAWHASLLALCLLVPLVDVGWSVWRQPAMRRDTASAIDQQIIQLRASNALYPNPSWAISADGYPAEVISSLSDSPSGVDAADPLPVRFGLTRRLAMELERIESMLEYSIQAPDDGNAWHDERASRLLMVIIENVSHPSVAALLDRTFADSGTPPDGASDAQPAMSDGTAVSRQWYRRAFMALADLTARQRLSNGLWEQGQADLGEMFLLDQLQSASSPSLQPSQRKQVLHQLADGEARRAARRRAIAALWWWYQNDPQTRGAEALRGGRLSDAPAVTWKDRARARRQASLVAEALWHLASASTPAEVAAARAEMVRVTGNDYFHGTPGDDARSTAELLSYSYRSTVDHLRSPGAAWGGSWEQVAETLLAAPPEASEADSP